MRTQLKDLCDIPMGRLAFAAVAGAALLATNAFAQSAREVRGSTPYLAIENEPPPKLIVDPPLAAGLAQGIAWIQYRVENVHILQVFGASALNVSPRVGHLHIRVDDLPWLWADASDNNTSRHSRATTGRTQGEDRVGQRKSSGLPRMRDVQPDGDVHGPGDQVSPTLKVAKSAQKPRRSKQFPKLPPSL